MRRTTLLVLFALAAGTALAADGDTVFHSDVSLVRVDTQVVDRDNHAVTGLHAEDFVLRDEGRPQPITNFASENMPVDLLLLLDVSRSMQPHIKHVASAAHKAFQVLRDQDRVGIMVFDRQTRVRLPYRFSRDEAEKELTALLKNEAFDGGTDITKGMLDAANYVAQHARPEARRAIVIVTDDRTQGDRDEAAVDRALTKADAVLCSLIAPAAQRSGYSPGGGGRRGGGGWGGGGMGGGWPGGGGGGWPGGGGGGRRGGGTPGNGQGSGGQSHSAGTAEIARDSGGDSLSLSEASALESTRILLNSQTRRFPKGVGNTHGLLGHYLMDHFTLEGAGGIIPSLGSSQRQLTGTPCGFLIPKYVNVGNNHNKNFLRGYRFDGDGSQELYGHAFSLPGFGKDWRRHVREEIPYYFGITAQGECLPDYNNFVELDPQVKDAWGIPVLRIHASYGENEKAMAKAMREDLLKILDAMKLESVRPPREKLSVFGKNIHECGTARMGLDPKKSVLDRFNRLHDVKNVLVTDGAAFVTQGPYEPTLTIMAISARAADHLVEDLRKGNL